MLPENIFGIIYYIPKNKFRKERYNDVVRGSNCQWRC